MNQLYAAQAVSVTELKKSYARVVAEADDAPVVVLNNNRPEAYLVPAAAFERLIDRLEDLEDAALARERLATDGPYMDVNVEDFLNGKDI